MKSFVSAYFPDDFDPSTMDEQVGRNIHAFNAELEAAGALFFACGLGPAQTVSVQSGGDALVTDGPYLETKEHIGGFLMIDAASLDEALDWARKGAIAAGGTVEVRPSSSMRGRQPIDQGTLAPYLGPCSCEVRHQPISQIAIPAENKVGMATVESVIRL